MTLDSTIHFWRVPASMHNGLVSRAAPGTHESVLNILESHQVPKDNCLELAAGTGALVSRLSSAGYQYSEIIERDLNSFQLKSQKATSLDLNTNFSNQVTGPFNLVTAIEIIEHLDSPRQFLEKIYSILPAGGFTIVSTPNVSHWLSRLQFLVKGDLKYFTAQDYYEQRHISPILDFPMRKMAEEIGFEIVEFKCTASSWGLGLKMLTMPIWLIFKLFGIKHIHGNVNIYLLKKRP